MHPHLPWRCSFSCLASNCLSILQCISASSVSFFTAIPPVLFDMAAIDNSVAEMLQTSCGRWQTPHDSHEAKERQAWGRWEAVECQRHRGIGRATLGIFLTHLTGLKPHAHDKSSWQYFLMPAARRRRMCRTVALTWACGSVRCWWWRWSSSESRVELLGKALTPSQRPVQTQYHLNTEHNIQCRSQFPQSMVRCVDAKSRCIDISGRTTCGRRLLLKRALADATNVALSSTQCGYPRFLLRDRQRRREYGSDRGTSAFFLNLSANSPIFVLSS